MQKNRFLLLFSILLLLISSINPVFAEEPENNTEVEEENNNEFVTQNEENIDEEHQDNINPVEIVEYSTSQIEMDEDVINVDIHDASLENIYSLLSSEIQFDNTNSEIIWESNEFVEYTFGTFDFFTTIDGTSFYKTVKVTQNLEELKTEIISEDNNLFKSQNFNEEIVDSPKRKLKAAPLRGASTTSSISGYEKTSSLGPVNSAGKIQKNYQESDNNTDTDYLYKTAEWTDFDNGIGNIRIIAKTSQDSEYDKSRAVFIFTDCPSHGFTINVAMTRINTLLHQYKHVDLITISGPDDDGIVIHTDVSEDNVYDIVGALPWRGGDHYSMNAYAGLYKYLYGNYDSTTQIRTPSAIYTAFDMMYEPCNYSAAGGFEAVTGIGACDAFDLHPGTSSVMRYDSSGQAYALGNAGRTDSPIWDVLKKYKNDNRYFSMALDGTTATANHFSVWENTTTPRTSSDAWRMNIIEGLANPLNYDVANPTVPFSSDAFYRTNEMSTSSWMHYYNIAPNQCADFATANDIANADIPAQRILVINDVISTYYQITNVSANAEVNVRADVGTGNVEASFPEYNPGEEVILSIQVKANYDNTRSWIDTNTGVAWTGSSQNINDKYLDVSSPKLSRSYYNLTINYLERDTNEVLSSRYTGKYVQDETYSIVSPDVRGFQLVNINQSTVSGTMPANDVSIDVYYQRFAAVSAPITINKVVEGIDTSNEVFTFKMERYKHVDGSGNVVPNVNETITDTGSAAYTASGTNIQADTIAEEQYDGRVFPAIPAGYTVSTVTLRGTSVNNTGRHNATFGGNTYSVAANGNQTWTLERDDLGGTKARAYNTGVVLNSYNYVSFVVNYYKTTTNIYYDPTKPITEDQSTFPEPNPNTITASKNSPNAFGSIQFDHPGVYTYKIYEVSGDTSGYTYDDTVHYVEFTVRSSTDISTKIDGVSQDTGIGSTEFNYTGGIQTFTAPYTTSYTFDVYGAEGGNGTNNGGKGGHSTGKYYMNAGERIYIAVGGKGGNYSGVSGGAGGWNGGGAGGNAYSSSVPYGGGGGGGATSITTTNRGVLSNYNSYRNEILFVAGGGGGSSAGSNGAGKGGNGGGTTTSNVSAINGTVIAGATQTSGYAFGQGEKGPNGIAVVAGSWGSCDTGSGGGGGGYFGGPSTKVDGISGTIHPGTGGTGYVSNTIAYGSTAESSHTGNGYVKIDYITPAPTDKNNITFTNRYTAPSSAKVNPQVRKSVNTNPAVPSETFIFDIEKITDTAPMPQNTTVSITGSGTASFGEIVYDSVGQYEYKISERKVPRNQYLYDSRYILMTVNVSLIDNKYTASATYKYVSADGTTQDTNEILFENTLITYTLQIKKNGPTGTELNNVKFRVEKIGSDGSGDTYYILNQTSAGEYQITGTTSTSSSATLIIPNTTSSYLTISGFVAGQYIIEEVETDENFVLPDDNHFIVNFEPISASNPTLKTASVLNQSQKQNLDVLNNIATGLEITNELANPFVDPPTKEVYRNGVKVEDNYVVKGEIFEYRITLKNARTTTINVKVEDVLASALDFVSATDGGAYNETNRKITWNNVPIPAKGSKIISVKVKVNKTGTVIPNTITEYYDTFVATASVHETYALEMTIKKEITGNVITAFGPAVFLYEISCGNEKEYVMIDLGSNTSGEKTISIPHDGNWIVKEISNARYKFQNISDKTSNVTIDGQTAIATLNKNNLSATVKFVNSINNFNKVSHASARDNRIEK